MSEEDIDRRWRSAIQAFREGDKAGALHIFLRLANDGEKATYREIGNIYELGGGGVAQDFLKAANWYRRSIYEANDVNGCLGLGRLYYYGKGVQQDHNKAFHYYSLSAGNNSPIAHLMLGRMYHTGKGVKRNVRLARSHYIYAAASGNIHAIKNLGILEREQGHFLQGAALRLRAVVQGFFIAYRNVHDPRLKGS